MDLQIARNLIDATLAEARRRETKPLAVVVLDEGGNMVACVRENGAGFGRLRLAEGKAWGSLSLGFGSRTLSERVGSAPTFFAAAASLMDGRLLPSPGGLLLWLDNLQVGAIGVSGDTGDIDETCAIAAAQSLGLTVRT